MSLLRDLKTLVFSALALGPVAESAISAGIPGAPDSSSLTEVHTLQKVPEGVLALLGKPIADADQPFNATDVMDGRPMRRFILAGISDTTVIVAYEQGGIAHYCVVAVYTYSPTGWTQHSQHVVTPRPETLSDLLKPAPAAVN